MDVAGATLQRILASACSSGRATMKQRFFILLIGGMAALGLLEYSAAAAGVQPSKWVYPSYIGDLLYGSDTNGVRINDFSNCGYKRGEVALPEMSHFIPEAQWIRLTPLEDGRDNAAMINAALYFAGTRPTNAHGFRGVVYLEAGEYRVDSTIWMTNSGVVLKGAGSSLTTGTRLRATFARAEDVISVTSHEVPGNEDATETGIAEWLVPAGTRTFRVGRVGDFKAGDLVWIRHLASWAWIHALDMDKLNGQWFGVGNVTGDYERQITRVEGDWITVDSPVPQTFELNYGGGTIRRMAADTRVGNCGVEDLACRFATNPGDDDNAHPTVAVHIIDAVNVWVRNVTGSGYFSTCVGIRGRSKFITVAECQMLHPSNSGHHNRYAFRIASTAGHVLMRDCFSENSRHDYVTESAVPGPNAFVRCRTNDSDDDTGPHQRWATGLLFDQVWVNDSGDSAKTSGQLNIQNRGNSGGGSSYHGWAGAYSTVWNCFAQTGYRVRNPPTALNWLIGSYGAIQASMNGCWWSPFWFGEGDCWAIGKDPAGTYDQSGTNANYIPVQLRSLYYAQLQQRLKAPSSEFREYRLGTIDQFRYSGWWDEPLAPVDANWLQEARGISGVPDGATNRFDLLRTNLYTAFTFDFPLAPGEQVIAGSITLGLRLVPGAVSGNQRLYLGSSDFSDSFSVLGWNVASSASSVHTALVVPWDLQDGKLSIGIGPDCGVDFAVLHLQVAPVISTSTVIEAPLDTYVRNGNFANQNFAADPELILKEDGTAGFARRAFLDWNLAEVKGRLIEAKVRLYCRYSGQPGNEQSASVVRDKGWSPASVTWNTQPAIPPAIAYWTPEPEAFVEFTVTPEVNAVLSAPVLTDRHFALALKSVQDFGGHGDVAYASREDPDPSHRPQLILRFVNSPPSIVAPGNVAMNADSAVGPLAVTIGDGETPADNLTLTANSPDFRIISKITFGGSGSNRTVTVTSASRASGTATITLTVSDGVHAASASFIVNVQFNNAAPVISPINSLATDEDIPALATFSISDAHSAAGDLAVAVSTSNHQLFPAGSIQPVSAFGGGPGSRSYLLSPAPNRFGTATVSVAGSDGYLATTQSFTLTVRSVEDAPTAVRMETPQGGDNLPPNIAALLRASAFDAETNLVRFQFYRQHPAYRIDQLIALATNAPFSAIWSNPPAGDCHLYAVAIDGAGLAATSPPVAISISVPEAIQPRIVIGHFSNSVVVLWPESFGSNSLQTATNLSVPILWSPLSSAPYLGQGAWIYDLPPSERRRFFRLVE